RDGEFNEYRASAVAGITGEKGSFMAGIHYYYQDPLKTPDREIASLDNAARAKKDLAAASYISPSYTGKVQARDGNGTVFLLANSPFLGPQSPTGSPAPGYNPG